MISNLSRKQSAALIGAAAVGVLMLIVAWFALYSPQLDGIAAAHAKTAAQQTTVKQLEGKYADLKTKSDNISTAEADLQKVQDQFPTSSDQAAWISMMKTAAAASNVTADAISPSVPTLGAAAGATPGAATSTGTATTGATAAATSTSTTVTTPSTTGTATGTTGTPTTGAAAGTTSAAGGATAATPNIATIAVTLSVSGQSGDIDAFLKKVETLDEPLLIKTFAVTGSGTKLTANITGETYLTREVPAPTVAKK